MLIKLMKHEFRATGRIMLPLYLVLLATAVGANISTRGLLETHYWFLNLLGGLLVMAFSFAIFGVCLMSVVVMVQRFGKNLLGDEGYVMLTLPASIHQQLWSKLIVSAVWFALTLVAVGVAGLVMAYDVGLVSQFFRALSELFRDITLELGLNGAALAGELLLLCFMGCCALCLQFYAALAAGHGFANHKGLWSVVFFFGIQFAVQMLAAAALQILDMTGILHMLPDWSVEGMVGMHLVMWTMIVAVVIYGAIFYGITAYCLKKHLNLE